MGPIERVQVSKQAKDQLVRLKRRTGIKNWNVVCRWALCVSLAEESIPPDTRIPMDSNVEMTWKTFGGTYHDVYTALLRERCQRDGLGNDDDTLAKYFRLHLHRGIGYLAGIKGLRSISDLMQLGLNAAA